MAPPKGNDYWKRVKNWKPGADRAYTPEELWNTAVEYFEYIERNPLKEQKAFGSGYKPTLNKMRAMTQKDFCIFAEISSTTFERYSTEDAYRAIISRIRDIIYTQKFQGAAAGLIDSNLIARELGLSDKVVNESTNLNMNADVTVTDEEAIRIKKALESKY